MGHISPGEMGRRQLAEAIAWQSDEEENEKKGRNEEKKEKEKKPGQTEKQQRGKKRDAQAGAGANDGQAPQTKRRKGDASEAGEGNENLVECDPEVVAAAAPEETVAPKTPPAAAPAFGDTADDSS